MADLTAFEEWWRDNRTACEKEWSDSEVARRAWNAAISACKKLTEDQEEAASDHRAAFEIELLIPQIVELFQEDEAAK